MGRPAGAAKAVADAGVQAPQTARRSRRAAAASTGAAASAAAFSPPTARRSSVSVKQEPAAASVVGDTNEESGANGARRGSKRKLDAPAAPASVAVKAEPGVAEPQRHADKAKSPRKRAEVKQEAASPAAVKQKQQLAAVKQEPLSPLRPSGSTKVKIKGWAAEADAAEAAAKGKVDLDEAPTAAPLGPFPEFKRPLPEECQVRALVFIAQLSNWQMFKCSTCIRCIRCMRYIECIKFL